MTIPPPIEVHNLTVLMSAEDRTKAPHTNARTTVGHAIYQMLSGHAHDALGAGGDWINIRANNARYVFVDGRQRRTNRTAETTHADETESIFSAYTIHSSEINAVFHRAAID